MIQIIILMSLSEFYQTRSQRNLPLVTTLYVLFEYKGVVLFSGGRQITNENRSSSNSAKHSHAWGNFSEAVS